MKDVLDDLENFEVEGGNSQAQRKSTLPSLPAENGKRKFSSWNTGGSLPKDKQKQEAEEADFLDEVDELLLEQDLLSPNSGTKILDKKSPVAKDQKQRKRQGEKLRDSTLDKLLSNEEDFLNK